MRLCEGDSCYGTVVSKQSFGVFVDFGAEKDGLVRIKDLRGNSRDLRRERYDSIRVGDEVAVDLISIENNGKRIGLSEKAVHDNLVFNLLPKNEVIVGVVINVKPFGAFVELLGYHVSGLLHNSKFRGNRKDRENYLQSLIVGGSINVCVEEVVMEDELRIGLYPA